MRFLLLAFFVGLALASTDEEGFRTNNHYVYRYEAQLVTGAPQSSRLWSALRLTANLNLYVLNEEGNEEGNDKIIAMLTSVDLQKMDKFVEDRTPSFFLYPQEKMLDGIEADVNQVMIKELEKPFSCRWKEGNVKQTVFEDSDPLWSINIKRGVLSLFQVSVNHHYSVDPNPNKGDQEHPNQPSYTVWESSPFGYCKTVYTPKESSVPDSFYLTKVRDYSSCVKETTSMTLSFNNFRSEDEKNDTKHLDLQGQVTYSIKGTKTNYLILTAVGESKTIFTPYAPKDGSVQTSINQTLYLRETRPLPVSEAPPTPPKGSKYSLEMTLPSQCVQDREPYVLHKSPNCQQHIHIWSVQKMDQLLTWAANATDLWPSEETVTVLQRLMEMIRQCSGQQLKQFLTQVQYEQQIPGNHLAKLKFKMLWELLGSAGTTEASKALLDTCLTDMSSAARPLYSMCIDAVTAINLFSPPSEVIMDKITKLVVKCREVEKVEEEESKVMQVRELHTVAVLCLGSVVGRAEDLMRHVTHVAAQQLQAMDQIIDMQTAGDSLPELENTKTELENRVVEIKNKHHTIAQRFAQTMKTMLGTNLDFDDLVALKCLRNAHVPLTIPIIEEVLTDQQRDPAIRVVAAQAMEKFCKGSAHPTAVSLLEEVLKNPKELSSVRIQAFRSLVNVRAPVHVLVRLAASLRYEQERQLTTYIWSVFNELCNCTFRPYRQAAADFRSAMAFMEPVHVGMQDSRYRKLRQPLADKVDVLAEGSYINTPESVVATDVASYWNIFGTTSKAVQISFLSDGLEKVIKTLMGPKGFFTDRNSLFDLLQRTKRGTDARDMIANIFQKLAITARTMPKTKAFVNLQLMNSVVRSFDLTQILQKIVDMKVIQADIDEHKMKAGVKFDYEKSGILEQFYLDLPSEAGFPVNLQMGVSYSGKVKGAVNAAVERNVYKAERGEQPPRKLKAGIYVEPQAVACVMGKMSVDGYLFQAGGAFHTVAEFRSPLSINTSLDFKHSHISVKFTPPVSQKEPVVRLEVKPYVYSLAIANTSSNQQRPVTQNPLFITSSNQQRSVTQRPLFITMQPVMISEGARIEQVHKSFGREGLGYEFTVEGQYPWRALPSATAFPLLGQAYYALYIRPGLEPPSCLQANFRYFPLARFRDPSQPKKAACDSWLSWFGFLCLSTDEREDVKRPTPTPTLDTMPVPYPDFPDLKAHLNYPSVVQHMERRFGEKIPSVESGCGWAFIATFNSSGERLERGATVECVVQSWKEGQYKQTWWAFTRTPVPTYDSQSWKMNIKTSAFYPSKHYIVNDLLDAGHQAEVNTQLLQMIQSREHKVTSKYFQDLLVTKINDYAMQRLPSLDPHTMLDRIGPELVLESAQKNGVQRILSILHNLLPLTHRVKDLKDEMKDAFKITAHQDELLQIGEKISSLQTQIAELLKYLGQQATVNRSVIVSADYTVFKVNQAVVDFKEIAQRAIHLQFVTNTENLNVILKKIEKYQETLCSLAKIHLSTKVTRAASDQKMSDRQMRFTNVEELNPRFTYYDSNPVDGAEDSSQLKPVPDVACLIRCLKKLVKAQLEFISQLWEDVVQKRPINTAKVRMLLSHTAKNVTEINQLIQTQGFKNQEVMMLVLQTTIQHQMCVDILQMVRFGNDSAQPQAGLDNLQRYAFKVQTKELLERSLILMDQEKLDEVCVSNLNSQEKKLMETLQQKDRELVALQQNRIKIPDHVTPWTSDVQNLKNAIKNTLRPVLKDCVSVRQAIVQQAKMPQPCLIAKLLDTITMLQQKIAIFKRTLPAQQEEAELTAMYQLIDDHTMDFVLSLNALFEKYINIPVSQQAEIPRGTGNILISQGLLEVTRIRQEQERVARQLATYLFNFRIPSFDTVRRILNQAADTCLELKKQLVSEAPRVKNSMQGTTPVSAFSLYSLYYQALEEQVHLYDTLQEQLQLYAKEPTLPNIGPQIAKDKVQMGKMMKEISEWQVTSPPNHDDDDDLSPTFFPPSTIPPVYRPSRFDQMGYSYNSYWAEDSQDAEPMDFRAASDSVDDDMIKRNSQPISASVIQPVVPPSCNEILYVVNITYGEIQTSIGITMRARKSVDQLLWEIAQFFPERRDHCVAAAIRQTIAGRRKLQPCCREVEQRLNSYNNINLDLDSTCDTLPPVVQYLVDVAVEELQTRYNDRTSVSGPQPSIPQGSLTAVLDITELMDCVNPYIMTETETVTAECVPLSPYFKAWYPFQNVAPQSQIVMQQYSNNRQPDSCKVEQFNVRTNDGYVFQIPRLEPSSRDTACRTLLAADCSPDQTFAITLQQSAKVPAQRVQILAEQHEVILVPDYMADTVSVDGQEKDLTYETPVIVFKKIAYGQEAVAIVISRQKGGAIHVEYPLTGLDIIFDFSYISVHMSTVYRNQLCGLCGNWDGQVTRELEGPKEHVFSAPKHFFYSYIIPDPQCPEKKEPSMPSKFKQPLFRGPVRPEFTANSVDKEDSEEKVNEDAIYE